MNTRPAPPRHRQWRHWQHAEPALAEANYDQVRAALRPGAADRADQDRLLAALVRIAHTDPDAVTILVECLRPGMAARVHRYGRGLDPGDAWGIVTLSLVEQITRYDTRRQPAFVARRLLWVPTRELKRTAVAARERQARQVPLDDTNHSTASADGSELTAAFLLARAAEAGAISPRSARLLHHVHLRDEPIATAAARCGIGYEAAKKAVQRANHRWATWWLSGDRPPRPHRAHRPRPAHRHPTSPGDT